ncbi:hypothetical protein NDU88_006210 [Pleurodeles waltl]|uniref:Uncharacterized protein n=1 Tax=Pleurodeles waltl TaxID=8319 RepID=A0AAV7WE53_PLEWA|nr:hypothetical protein NDU88_006210 [Pleurodeles waltl]
MTVLIFSDFSMVMQDACRKFIDIKAALRKLGLHYGMLYAARLNDDVDGRPRIFDNPTDVLDFCTKYAKEHATAAQGSPERSPPDTQLANSMNLFLPG